MTTFLALMPMMLLAQAPNLGVCASFALYTPVGALANTGVQTSIIGNIGTNSGAITDYPAGSIQGQIHNGDAMTRQAAIDVQAAYDHLVNMPCTGVSLAPAMGTNQTLTPATYCHSGASSVAGDLILDGQHQANALFVFKINGAFSCGAASRVLLINGARASNVYWQVGGAASFAATSALVGTIIAEGAVAFGDGVSLHGRGFSTVGAISTYNNRISSTEASPLPVELATFTVQAQGGTAVALTWRTVSEKNSARFELERGTNGTAFSRIGAVPAAGNSSAPRSYSWTDETLPTRAALLYYRLRQIDVDGTATFSPVRTVSHSLTAKTQLLVYPNPAHGAVHVQLLGPPPTEPVQLLNAHGQIVQTQPTLGANGMMPLTGLPAGLYVLRCGPLAQRLTLE